MRRALGLFGGCVACHILFDDNMRIGAGKTERTDPGNAAACLLLPIGALRGDLNRHTLPVNLRTGLPEMQMLRQMAMLQGQNGFDDTCDTSRRFQMA